MLPERAAWLFKRFGVKPPDSRNDIHVRLSDMADDRVPVIEADTTLLDAVTVLKDSAMPRLPVVEKDKTFLGMLSPLTLLSKLLNVGCDSQPRVNKMKHNLQFDGSKRMQVFIAS